MVVADASTLRSRVADIFGLGARSSEADGHRAITWLAVVGLAAGGLLAVIGLPPLDVHGPLHRFGVMDPACGMTRGVRLVLRGSLAQAVRYNPASPLVVVGAAAVVVRYGFGAVTGRWLNITLRPRPVGIAVLAVLLGALWLNQQHHASLLLH